MAAAIRVQGWVLEYILSLSHQILGSEGWSPFNYGRPWSLNYFYIAKMARHQVSNELRTLKESILNQLNESVIAHLGKHTG